MNNKGNSSTLAFGTIGLIGGGIIGATIIAPIATPVIVGIAGIGAIGLTSTAIGAGVVCATSLVTATFSSLVGNFFDKEREKSEQQKNEEEYKRNVARDRLLKVLIDTIPEGTEIHITQDLTKSSKCIDTLIKISNTEESIKEKTHRILDEIYDSYYEFTNYAIFFNNTLKEEKSDHANILKKLKNFLENPTNQTPKHQADEKRKHALVEISYFREEEITEDVSLLFKKTTAYNRKMAFAIIDSDHEPRDKIYALSQLKKILFLCTTFGSDEVKQKFKEALKDNEA